MAMARTQRNPSWLFYGPQFPEAEEILAALHARSEAPEDDLHHPHFGNNAED